LFEVSLDMSRKLILLVEDSPDDEALMLRAFHKSGLQIEIAVARDGEEALEYLFATGRYAARNPTRMPDVVFSDVKLPKIDGLELVHRIRSDERTRELPVVLLSSSTQISDVRRAYRQGTNSYIRKPVNAEEFINVVRQLASYWSVLNESLSTETPAEK
jgi:two-component system response regulator